MVVSFTPLFPPSAVVIFTEGHQVHKVPQPSSEELAREERQKVGHGSDSILQGLASGRVWHLVFVYLGMTFGLHILSSWAPQLVKALSALYSNSVIGLLLIMPNVIGLVAMILVSRSSDRMLERRYHVAIPAVVAGTALLLLGTAPSPVLSMALLLSSISVSSVQYAGFALCEGGKYFGDFLRDSPSNLSALSRS